VHGIGEGVTAAGRNEPEGRRGRAPKLVDLEDGQFPDEGASKPVFM
jgi:hypothetical protein